MRHLILALLALLLLVASIVAWRAASWESRQPVAENLAPIRIEQRGPAERLARALQFRTISHGGDSRRDDQAFLEFRRFLTRSFGPAHHQLRRELISEHTLLYTWPGSDPELAPVLLLGHYDVVPVEADNDWTHPPFGGVLDQGYIWGRGAIDNKSGVMGILEAVNRLAKQAYRPRRTLLLAFGHDEEIGGEEGAAQVAARLAERGIRPHWIMDEGGLINHDNTLVGGPLALIGTGEKGYLSLRLTVRGEGGHSSRPPPETAAGILAGAVHRVQQTPFEPRYVSPTRDMFEYLTGDLGGIKRVLFANTWLFEPLLLGRLAGEAMTGAMVRTTTAPTMLRGSAKDNVLPIRAEGVINFRILPGETVESVTQRVRQLVADERVEISRDSSFGIDPSPVSPSDDEVFRALTQAIVNSFPDTLVAPYLVVGATDARHYAELSPRVYRFLPYRVPSADLKGFHGTDERLGMQAYVDGIRFYQRLIRSATQ